MNLIFHLSFLSAVWAARSTPPDGAIIVAKSGGDYETIGKAIMALDAGHSVNQTIFTKAGIYNEQVQIPEFRGRLTIYGETSNTSAYSGNTVTVIHNISATGDGDKTATIRNSAAASRIYNINVANIHGPGQQAVALSATGTQQGYYGCQFTGHNRTVRIQVGGTSFFAQGVISGTTDFIFGRYARVWFEQVDIRVRSSTKSGAITANERDSPNDPSYYMINNLIFMAASESVKRNSSFLGHPEASYARVVLQNTYMSDIVNSAGWSEWSLSRTNTADVLFGEYDNCGPGSQGPRASFATVLSSPVAIGDILNDGYETWVDQEYLGMN